MRNNGFADSLQTCYPGAPLKWCSSNGIVFYINSYWNKLYARGIKGMVTVYLYGDHRWLKNPSFVGTFYMVSSCRTFMVTFTPCQIFTKYSSMCNSVLYHYYSQKKNDNRISTGVEFCYRLRESILILFLRINFDSSIYWQEWILGFSSKF